MHVHVDCDILYTLRSQKRWWFWALMHVDRAWKAMYFIRCLPVFIEIRIYPLIFGMLNSPPLLNLLSPARIRDSRNQALRGQQTIILGILHFRGSSADGCGMEQIPRVYNGKKPPPVISVIYPDRTYMEEDDSLLTYATPRILSNTVHTTTQATSKPQE